MFRALVTSIVFSCLAYGWPDNDFNGISQLALVANNLDEATKFYTDLGGMHVTRLSTGMYKFFLLKHFAWRVRSREVMFSQVYICPQAYPLVSGPFLGRGTPARGGGRGSTLVAGEVGGTMDRTRGTHQWTGYAAGGTPLAVTKNDFFVTDGLDGKLRNIIVNLQRCFSDGIWGDSHYYRLFQTQLLDIKNSNGAKTLTSEGVLDISDSGDWKVSAFCYQN